MAFWDKRKNQDDHDPEPADPTPEPETSEPGPPLPRELLWLLDAPMFIDEKQVEAFYDAVLRPDYEGASLTLSDSVAKGAKVVGETTVGAAIPWLAKAEASVSGEGSRTHEAGSQTTLNVISNAYRHLVALAIHYATEQPERLVLRGDTGAYSAPVLKDQQSVPKKFIGDEWAEDDFIQRSPRALLFLDLPKGTKFIPAALELTDGRTLPLFEQLARDLQEPGGVAAPKYPGSDACLSKRDGYWQWFTDNFKDGKALELVEGAGDAGQKIAWIAFRVPLAGNAGPFMHLHIAARGEYDTGVFGYNFIRRGSKHGIRIVGTLKSEPDLNVLAIFER